MNWKKHRSNSALIMLLLAAVAPAQGQVELRYRENETVTWNEAIQMYEWLDAAYHTFRYGPLQRLCGRINRN